MLYANARAKFPLFFSAKRSVQPRGASLRASERVGQKAVTMWIRLFDKGSWRTTITTMKKGPAELADPLASIKFLTWPTGLLSRRGLYLSASVIFGFDELRSITAAFVGEMI